MKNLLFISYPLESLLLPTFGLAKIISINYKVTYAASSKFEKVIKAHDFQYVNLECFPFAYGHEKVFNLARDSSSLYFDCVSDRMNNRLYNEREKGINSIIASLNPELIIVDILCSSDFVILYKYCIENNAKVIIFNTMLSTYYSRKVPHIGSSFSPINKVNILVEYFMTRIVIWLKNAADWLAHAGYSSKRMLLNQMVKNKIPQEHGLLKNRTISYFFKNIPEVIAAPRELEFTNMPLGLDQYYIGSLLYPGRIELFKTVQFDQVFNQVRNFKKQGNDMKFIYCSFGTMHGEWNQIISKFLDKLFKVVMNLPNYMMICAYDEGQHLITPAFVSSNIIVFKRVPQLMCLQLADLFITHGGLGSVKESISAGVPMLAYPMTKKWDTTGHSSKIAYHGIGLVGDIKRDSCEIISNKIARILCDSKYYKNIARIKTNSDIKYSKDNILDLLQEIIQRPLYSNDRVFPKSE